MKCCDWVLKDPFLQFMEDFKAFSFISYIIYEEMTANFCLLCREFNLKSIKKWF